MSAEPSPRRFTAEEVLRMVEAGILDEDEPVELIDGELIVVGPQGPRHRALSVRLHQALERAFGDGFHVQDHSAVDTYLDRHPAGPDLELVVEISITSQRFDRAKALVYARAGVATYWQLDVPARRLLVHSDPRDGEYRTTRVLTEDDALGIGTLRVADLLPPA